MPSRARSSRPTWLPALCLFALLIFSACGWSAPPTDPPTPETHTVKGLITELEFGKMSFRVDDGRQLILEVTNGPVPEDQLRTWFDNGQKLQVTYRPEASRLIPLSIVEAPPS